MTVTSRTATPTGGRATNRYLRDNFAPVREELTATDLAVTGELPGHLDGRYLRIGPNPLDDPGDQHHWFLGEGMVHGVRLRDGQAQWYRNRWVRSAGVAEALGEPVRGTPGGFDFAANTNVLVHGGRTLALVESGPPPYELTHELDTVGPCDFGGTLPSIPGRPGYTAHPHRDPDTGELHAVSYSWMRGNRVAYSVLDTSGRIRRSVDVEVHGSPMIHDFALTERHVVILDLPVTFDIATATADAPRLVRPVVRGLLNRIIGRNPVPEPLIAQVARGGGNTASLPYRWNPDYPARIGVLPRDAEGDAVRWFEIDPCYVFHTLNAYDDGDRVVVDVVRHPRMFDTVLTGPDEGPATLCRITLDLTTGRAHETWGRPALAGVPAPRRAADRPSAPLRLGGRLRGRRAGRHRAAPRPGGRHHRVAQPRRRDGVERVLLRPRPRRHRRGRRGAAGVRPRPRRGSQPAAGAGRDDPRGRRLGAPARAGAGRLPRELGAGGDRPGRRLDGGRSGVLAEVAAEVGHRERDPAPLARVDEALLEQRVASG